jgi:hypothetical protein
MNDRIDGVQPIRLNTELRRELATGEHILWEGAPDPGRMRVVFAMWLFAIPWTLFALAWTGLAFTAFWTGMTTQQGLGWWGWIFPLWGTPFIAVGLWMMNKPLEILADAKHTVHALTNQRLITLTIRKGRAVKTAPIKKLGPLRYKEKQGGWGDLSAETGSHIDSDGDRITEKFEMVGVPDVAKLHRLLIEAQQGD